MMTEWFAVFCIGLAVVMTPGPNFAMAVQTSLLRSRRAGLYTAIGIACGGLTHVSYSLIGIGMLIAQSILLFNLLKWIGVAYLIYLGIKALRAKPHAIQTNAELLVTQNRRQSIRSGFLTCLLNPKATMFFFALFTQVIQPDTPLPIRALYGLTIVAIQLSWYSLVALVISQPRIRGGFGSVLHHIEHATGLAMIGFGIRLALSRRSS
jgi:RhtB (resistance to homoserine/threonine) family protein